MTRFARAKGSKASNERLPNDPTPWHVMKQQLVENLSTSQEYSEKTKSAKELLHDEQYTNDVTNGKSQWAEFEDSCGRKYDSEAQKIKKRKTQSNTVEENQKVLFDKDDKGNIKIKKRGIEEVDNSMKEVKNKKHKKSHNQYDDINSSQKNLDQVGAKINETDTNADKSKKNRNKSKYNTNKESTEPLVENSNTIEMKSNEDNVHDSKDKPKGMLSKRQKRNMKRRQNTGFETTNGTNSKSISDDINNGKNESTENCQSRRFDQKFGNHSTNFRNGPYNFGTKRPENNKKKQKPPKIRDDKEHKRRKPDVGYTKLVINGVEVEIVKFDGFPVKKEDADRLHELKRKMIMKGIPKKDINAAMKLERRKAEKALSRIKKCVCFHCRKAGHNLSDCPELGAEQAGTGICFKCGSTEHTHFECKVAKPTEFRYATCFICREQGHIAKQCPDNPKGVYPQGGCCNICGDVTHLKKDCPDLIKEKEESTVTITTIANGDLESLEESNKISNEKNDNKSKKIVKF